MPEYDVAQSRRSQGYTFPELVKVCEAALRALLSVASAASALSPSQIASGPPGGPAFTADQVGADVVFHDWGCVVGCMMVNSCPSLVKKVVLLDVAPPELKYKASKQDISKALIANPPLGANAFVQLWRVAIQLNYMNGFAVSFALSRLFKPLGYLSLYLMSPIFFRPFSYVLSPADPGGVVPRPITEVSVHYTNVYYQFLTGLLSPKLREYFFKNFVFPPGKSVQFLYGKANNTFFHTPQTLAKIDALSGSEHKGMDGGHWFYHKDKKATAREVVRFLGLESTTTAKLTSAL